MFAFLRLFQEEINFFFFFPNTLIDISVISDKNDPDARLNTYTPQSGHVHLTDAASLINLREHLR